MGCYDTFIKDEQTSAQLKVDPDWNTYKIGDEVHIPDGIYLDYGGAVVVKNKRFVGIYASVKEARLDGHTEGGVVEPGDIFDKWGGEVDEEALGDRTAREYILDNNPMKEVLDSALADWHTAKLEEKK